MYQVKRKRSNIIVCGPEEFEAKINPDAIGVVIRRRPDFPYEPAPYAIQSSEMTDAELVAYALGIESYPV